MNIKMGSIYCMTLLAVIILFGMYSNSEQRPIQPVWKEMSEVVTNTPYFSTSYQALTNDVYYSVYHQSVFSNQVLFMEYKGKKIQKFTLSSEEVSSIDVTNEVKFVMFPPNLWTNVVFGTVATNGAPAIKPKKK